MGRLTLNVLLSFAQFEREVTSERIRDKIAASKRKGLWVGGVAPLGYDTKGRKISINDVEADRVRTIFRSYLRLGSLNRLMTELRDQGIITKVRILKTGETVGGIPFTRGPVPANSAKWVLIKAGHVVVRLRCGAGGKPWRCRCYNRRRLARARGRNPRCRRRTCITKHGVLLLSAVRMAEARVKHKSGTERFKAFWEE